MRDYILVEEMAVDGPVEGVSESTPVEDPNTLLLRSPARKVPHRAQAHLSLAALFPSAATDRSI